MSRWLNIGGIPVRLDSSVPTSIEVVNNISQATDSDTLYIVAEDSTPGSLVGLRANGWPGSLVSSVMIGGDTVWQSSTLEAIGGTITEIDVAGVNYRVHTFTESGNFEVLSGVADIEYLIVAGGGGGGGGDAGGGGGGGGGE